MFFSENLSLILISAHFDHAKDQDPDFLSNRINHLRSVIIEAARLLEKDRSIWTHAELSQVNFVPQGFSVSNALDIFTRLLDEASLQNGFDIPSVYSLMCEPLNRFARYHETLDTLIISCTEKKIDFASLFALVKLAKITPNDLYTELIAHYALSTFRRANGYVSLLGTGYTPSNKQSGWDDYELSRFESRRLVDDPEAVTKIMSELEKKYREYKNRIIVKF